MKTHKRTVTKDEAEVRVLQISANKVNGMRLFYDGKEIPDTDTEAEIIEGEVTFDIPSWIPVEDFIQQLDKNDNNPMSTLVSLKFVKASNNRYYDPEFDIENNNIYAKNGVEVGYGFYAQEAQRYQTTFIAQWFVPYNDSLHSRELIMDYFKEDSSDNDSFSLILLDRGVLIEAEVRQHSDFNAAQISFLPMSIENPYYQTLEQDEDNTFGESILYELEKNGNNLEKAVQKVKKYSEAVIEKIKTVDSSEYYMVLNVQQD